MWIGNMHLNIVQGDYRFPLWNEGEFKKYKKKIHELRCQGYRKIGQELGYLDDYEYYKRKGKKKIITIVRMYP